MSGRASDVFDFEDRQELQQLIALLLQCYEAAAYEESFASAVILKEWAEDLCVRLAELDRDLLRGQGSDSSYPAT